MACHGRHCPGFTLRIPSRDKAQANRDLVSSSVLLLAQQIVDQDPKLLIVVPRQPDGSHLIEA